MSRTRPTDRTVCNRLVNLVKEQTRERQEQLLAWLTTGTVPVSYIADRFHVSWRTVQRAIKSGKVKGVRAGLRWAVSEEEFQRLEREGFPLGASRWGRK